MRKCDGSQDYDLALRVIEQIDESHSAHSHILYHWRAVKGSVAFDFKRETLCS